jgi:hypothetical protein
MMMLEVKSVPNLLGTPVSYAYAVKAGPWIFLTGHEAFDFESGISEEVAGPASFPLFGRPRSRREGDFILHRMRKILREFGSDLSRGVRLDQYYPNPRAVAAYHLARHAEFGDYIPPSTSVIMERCFSADTTISSSLVAVVPGAEYEIRKIHPEGWPPRRHSASCRPWSATSSCSSPDRWRTTRGRGSTRARMYPNTQLGPAPRSASRPNS